MSLNFTPIKRRGSPVRGPEIEPSTPGPHEELYDEFITSKESVQPTETEVGFAEEFPDVVALSEEIKAAGVEAVEEAPTVGPSFPIDDTQLYENLDKPIDSPRRWVGELYRKMLLKAGFLLRKVHGHVKRVALWKES
ncbi:MAG: hypothetical protein UZ21_OP11001001095 [Microgenomates bacterium OLB22]|nr:MAG: hypothetical protein UZ21_OP11001001095 [Microgenomates bacterium OLB22]